MTDDDSSDRRRRSRPRPGNHDGARSRLARRAPRVL